MAFSQDWGRGMNNVVLMQDMEGSQKVYVNGAEIFPSAMDFSQDHIPIGSFNNPGATMPGLQSLEITFYATEIKHVRTTKHQDGPAAVHGVIEFNKYQELQEENSKLKLELAKTKAELVKASNPWPKIIDGMEPENES